jgi:hypothetical protein
MTSKRWSEMTTKEHLDEAQTFYELLERSYPAIQNYYWLASLRLQAAALAYQEHHTTNLTWTSANPT